MLYTLDLWPVKHAVSVSAPVAGATSHTRTVASPLPVNSWREAFGPTRSVVAYTNPRCRRTIDHFGARVGGLSSSAAPAPAPAPAPAADACTALPELSGKAGSSTTVDAKAVLWHPAMSSTRAAPSAVGGHPRHDTRSTLPGGDCTTATHLKSFATSHMRMVPSPEDDTSSTRPDASAVRMQRTACQTRATSATGRSVRRQRKHCRGGVGRRRTRVCPVRSLTR